MLKLNGDITELAGSTASSSRAKAFATDPFESIGPPMTFSMILIYVAYALFAWAVLFMIFAAIRYHHELSRRAGQGSVQGSSPASSPFVG